MNYVKFYAKQLKKDNSIFKQQKLLIESQIKSSRQIFSHFGKGATFRKNARKYLKL
ncbi:MAG: hypothetical protein MAG795_00472 [Candidatus Woesearchaeota archaeon]|nr:hypothetical protein [Candidatus Woesearchaeota archaeon]